MATQPAQAPAMTQRSVAESIVAQLGIWGVSQIFGVQGRTILGILDAVNRQDAIRYIETRQEEAAALMASAYAKLTDHLAVCIASSGPGVGNLLTGLYDAQADGAPVVALCGEDRRSSFGRGAYQAIDQHALFETCSHFNHDLMDAQQMPEFLMLACKAAMEQRGVGRLGIPLDLARLPVNASIIGPAGHLAVERWAAPAQRVVEAIEMLAGAQRPAILLGWGGRHCRDFITHCADNFDAAIVTTCRAKGIVPESYPRLMGVVGRFGTSLADSVVRNADVLLVVGSSLSENTTDGWTLIPDGTRLIQIDIDSEHIGRNHDVTLPMVGDAFLTMEQINRQAAPVHHPDYQKKLSDEKRNWMAKIANKAQSDAQPILPQRVIRTLSNICADNAIIAVDVGDHAVFFYQQFPIRNHVVLSSGQMGVMGFSLPAANAAALAFPTRQCIALCGDGGFSAIMGEFLTACQYHLPITVVLLDNNQLGMTKTEQEHDRFPSSGFFTNLAGCDYAAYATACGGMGVRVKKVDDLQSSLERALSANVPALVQIDVDPHERPLSYRLTTGTTNIIVRSSND